MKNSINKIYRFLTKNKIVVILIILFGLAGTVYSFLDQNNKQKLNIKNSPNSINTIGQIGNNMINGQSLLIEIPTGQVNGVNTIFTVLHKPLYINEDGMDRFEGTDYEYLNSEIKIIDGDPPVMFIKSFY